MDSKLGTALEEVGPLNQVLATPARVVAELIRSREPISTTELVRRLGVTRTEIARNCEALVAVGVLSRPQTGLWGLGGLPGSALTQRIRTVEIDRRVNC